MAMIDNPYLLLTPGPLSTSAGVRNAMQRDWCTWDKDYNELVQSIRERLLDLAGFESAQFKREQYSAVLMQGSGTASVESVIGSAHGPDDHLLVLVNGAYGKRIAQIAECLGIRHTVLDFGEQSPVNLTELDAILQSKSDITSVAIVHCETTTGMLNDIAAVSECTRAAGKRLIVDAMSSFGGIPIDIAALEIDFLISSANKCIQGVPGFGFVVAKRTALEACKGQAKSLSLDLYDQWHCMEENNGKWRFTSPTHVVRAFDQALKELELEGGIRTRFQRYQENQKLLVSGMIELGFAPLLPSTLHSPFITTFMNPEHAEYSFNVFYERLKHRGFVIYPGKVSQADCFRIGSIGEVYKQDIEALLDAISKERYWIA
jgi:2-aminoethylphosphonate-pyruvate transaminase